MTPIFSGFVAVIVEGGSIQRQELSLLLFSERELHDSAQVRPRPSVVLSRRAEIGGLQVPRMGSQRFNHYTNPLQPLFNRYANKNKYY